MVTEHIRKLIENYLTLTIWLMSHDTDSSISSDQFDTVLEELGKVEDQLMMHGVSQQGVEGLLDHAEYIFKTPFSELPESTQLRLGKIIFGGETKLSLGGGGPKGGKDAKAV